MDQEKVGKFIKSIRLSEGISQQKFALKYGVTYQAVSKWENGKNIPDLAILKRICEDYNMNLDDLLETKIPKKKRNKKLLFFLLFILILCVLVIAFLVMRNKSNNFEFKKLSPSCNNFNLYGSIAYNDKKSSIYISNITYCGDDDNKKYKKITCCLYEVNDKVKMLISKCNEYEDEESISLEKFLNGVNFNVDHYDKVCKIYKENSLYLEIEAIDMNDRITTYKIPLKLEDNCKN